VIEVRDLAKTFSTHRKAPGLMGSLRGLVRRERVRKEAVRGVTFDVAPGEIVGLVGPNGAGKTTVVKMLAGIIHPSAGHARVLGHDPWRREDAFRRRIALVMGQKQQLWWDLPAADSFLLLREIYALPPARFQASLDHLVDVLDVRDQLTIPVRRLSLGERMKLELVAALLHQPDVVFLDEPTIGLDLTAQRAIRTFLLDYQREHQPAVLLTSHYMEDIERLCPRILILREGGLVFDGPLREIHRRYADHKVVTAHRRPGADGVPEAALGVWPEDLGVVVETSPTEVRVRVPRARVAAAAQLLLQRLDVADLAIQEEDIGSVIERIYRERDAGTP
jgi:ABC-2 type transport system ATP-binding protein